MESKKYKNVIVFDGRTTHDWPALFQELNLMVCLFVCLFSLFVCLVLAFSIDHNCFDKELPDGSFLRIVQTSWYDCEITVFDNYAQLSCKPVHDSLGQGKNRETGITIEPHFCLLRNQPRGATPASDKRNGSVWRKRFTIRFLF